MADISIELHKLKSFFNTFDPSPFWEKDLDGDAIEYLIESAKSIPHEQKARIILHIPKEEITEDTHQVVSEAIANNFTFLEKSSRNRLKKLLSDGRIALIIGILFLTGCIALSDLLSRSESLIPRILSEGLIVAGWVGLWKPISIFLYEWWPIWREILLFRRIGRMPIIIKEKKAPKGIK